jgi:hypothetical protein
MKSAAFGKKELSAENQNKRILWIMGQDIAPDDHIEQLKMDLYRFTNDLNFKMPKKNGKCT